MRPRSDRAAVGRLPRAFATVLAAVFVAVLALPAGAVAQERKEAEEPVFERLYLDRLRLSALSVSAGAVKPTQMNATRAYAVSADYGAIVPQLHVIFTATFWQSQLNDETVRRFRERIEGVIVSPAGDSGATVDVGRISVQDIAIGGDLRWYPRRSASTTLRPYVGGGVSAHVLNAEGRAINDTFVERALDNITAGLAASVGLDVVFFSRVSLVMQARYDLLSGARFGSLRLGGGYLFRPIAVPARR